MSLIDKEKLLEAFNKLAQSQYVPTFDAKVLSKDVLDLITNAQPLQAHDNEIISKCADVASLAFDSNDIVDAILALKA